ncbi:hypothetical protein TELCIR_12040 [Teladorsagia circumcincta]|uniref:Uncharacterized protein n=1 Tax=Teladorsagia circumcincta TaxID=45464 RepID=A0A2G9U967_TELCI|nr:hypothetical protein TELCIR_12040 [Teladorsagia circumcincta]
MVQGGGQQEGHGVMAQSRHGGQQESHGIQGESLNRIRHPLVSSHGSIKRYLQREVMDRKGQRR